MLPSRSLCEKVLSHLIWNVNQQRRLTSWETDKNNAKTKKHQIKKWLPALPFSSRQISPDPERQSRLHRTKISHLIAAPLCFWNLRILPEFWNGLDKNMRKIFFPLKKKKKTQKAYVEACTFRGCVAVFINNREEERWRRPSKPLRRRRSKFTSSTVTVRWLERANGCVSVCVCLCVCASASLSLHGMAATWRRSWSGPEGGRGTQWWRSRAAGGRSRPPPGLLRDSAARWCSCKHSGRYTEVMWSHRARAAEAQAALSHLFMSSWVCFMESMALWSSLRSAPFFLSRLLCLLLCPATKNYQIKIKVCLICKE